MILGVSFLFNRLGMRLFFPTIPKPLKQYTLFEKKTIYGWTLSKFSEHPFGNEAAID
jgi:hypothetical protein